MRSRSRGKGIGHGAQEKFGLVTREGVQKLFGKPTKKEESPQPEDGLKRYKSMDLTVKPAKLQRVSGQFGVCSSEFSLFPLLF